MGLNGVIAEFKFPPLVVTCANDFSKMDVDVRKELIRQIAGEDISVVINMELRYPKGFSPNSILKAKNIDAAEIVNCDIFPAVEWNDRAFNK